MFIQLDGVLIIATYFAVQWFELSSFQSILFNHYNYYVKNKSPQAIFIPEPVSINCVTGTPSSLTSTQQDSLLCYWNWALGQ